jgi:hypothetical protein
MGLQSQAKSGKTLSYVDIENEMIRLMNHQESMTERLAELARDMSAAEADHKANFHIARYEARVSGEHGMKVTADMAEDIAVMATVEFRRKAEGLRAEHDATKQAILTARSNQESLRSLMASYRESGG